MAKFDQLVEDYSTRPVPVSRTVSGLRIALVIIGIGIALPGFLGGAQIGSAMGLEKAAWAFLCGGVVLAIFGSLTSMVAARARLTTYILVQYSFGRTGARFVNFVLAATMFGWFGVNAALFGEAVLATMRSLYGLSGAAELYVVLGSMLMILTTIFGFRALDRLSLLAVPLLALILVYVLVLSLTTADPDVLFAPREAQIPMGWAISAVIGGNMVMVATVPDLARFASSRRQAILAMFLSFVIAAPLVLLAAAVPSLATGESDLMKIIMGLGFGLAALYVVIFSTWTSNAANLYSAGLSFKATFPALPRWLLTVLAGLLGTVVAISGVIEMFIPFLLLLGVTVPPVAAIYVADFYRHYRRVGYNPEALAVGPAINWAAFATWAVASGLGIATAGGILRVTGIPAFDATLAALGVYLGLTILVPYFRTLRVKEV